MKKFFFLFLVIVIWGGTLLAQSTTEKPQAISGGVARTAALGGNPNNPYITDYTDVFTNPAYANKYSDLLFINAGNTFGNYTAAGQYVGWITSVSGINIGIAVGQREGPMFAENAYGTGTFSNSDYMVANLTMPIASAEPLPPVQVFGSFKTGEMIFGASIYRSGWSLSDNGTGSVNTTQKNEMSNNQTGIKLGVLIGSMTDLMIDGAVLFRLNGSSMDFTDSDTAAFVKAIKYDATGTELGFNARIFYKLSDKTWLTPTARFLTFSYAPEVTTTPAPSTPNTKPNEFGKTEFEIGVGTNTNVESGTVSVGVSIQMITLTNDVTVVSGTTLQTTKNSRTIFDLPKLNIGGEFWINGWSIARVGYFKRFSTVTTTVEPPSPGVKTETSTSSTPSFIPNLGFSSAQQQLSLGLGFVWNRLALDGYMGERFLAAGPWFISGNLQDMFGVLTLSFKL